MRGIRGVMLMLACLLLSNLAQAKPFVVEASKVKAWSDSAGILPAEELAYPANPCRKIGGAVPRFKGEALVTAKPEGNRNSVDARTDYLAGIEILFEQHLSATHDIWPKTKMICADEVIWVKTTPFEAAGLTEDDALNVILNLDASGETLLLDTK